MSGGGAGPRTRGLLRRSSARHFLRHGWQTALAVLGVGLGVTVVLGVDLAVSSARRGFVLSTETVAGLATHRIEPGPAGLPDSLYRTVRRVAGVSAAAAGVEGPAVAADGTTLRLIGIDPFAEASFRRFGGRSGEAAGQLIGVRAGLVSRSTAGEVGVTEGDWLRFDVGGRVDSVRVAALVDPSDEAARVGMEGLVLVDIGTAQSLLDVDGLDRIDLIVDDTAALDGIRSAIPPDASLRPAGAAAAGFEEMTRSFDLNLRAMSLLALIFGLFLIYNSVTFSVVQRRGLLATLRSLGATRRELFLIIQGESLLLGLAGALIGLVLGTALGSGLVHLVTRTIEDLYFVATVRELIISPVAVAKALALGVLGTMAVAVPASLEAAGTRPRVAMLRSTLETGLRRRLPALSAAGLALAAAGLLVLVRSGSVNGSFVGLFGVILGLALLTPATTVLLMRLLRRPLGRVFGVIGRMAAGGVESGLSRTAPAVAALTIAVAATLGVTVMVSSFRGSLVRWLDRTLSADLYITPARPGPGGSPPALDPAAVAAASRDPAVADARRYWRGTVATPEGPIGLMAVDSDDRFRGQLEFLDGGADWDALAVGEAVLVSEPFAYRRGTAVGDTLVLRTAGGTVGLPVTGVFRDYGSDRGLAMIGYEGYRRLWGDSTVTALALNLVPGSDPDAVRDRIAGATPGRQALRVRSDRRMAEASLEVFDRTFTITEVLRALTLVVAFVGVASALMALQLERGRELGVLRANGMTPGQLGTMVASQTGLMGLAAGLMALPMGVLLAVLMIEFVNRRSFGWTMELAVPPMALLQALAVAVGAALVAGLYPSWRMARTSPAEALRSE